MTTAALTTSVSGTDSLGASITKIFQDPNVEAAIGGGIGGVLNAGLGAVFGTGQTDAQKAAAAAAAEAQKQAQQTTLLIAGGAGVVVVIVIIAVVMHRSRK